MDRLEIVRKIDDLLDNRCKTCPDRPTQEANYQPERQRYCNNVCPIGIKLQGLGDKLFENINEKRSRKR